MCSFETALSKEKVTQLAVPPVECTFFIQNPSNRDEWLFFLNHTSYSSTTATTINDICSYNRNTNKFSQVKFDTCPKKDGLQLEQYSKLYVCKGCRPNTVIVMSRGSIRDRNYECYHFYNVLNTKKMKWQKKDNSKKYITNLKSNSKNCRLAKGLPRRILLHIPIDFEKTSTAFDHLVGPKKQLITFKNWIIVSGSDRRDWSSLQNIMTIYELDTSTQQPKRAKTIELDRKYENHAMKIISHSENVRKKKFKVKILLFGGVAEHGTNLFLNSFSVVNIVFTKSDYHQSFDISYKMYQISSKWMENNIFCNHYNSPYSKLIKEQRIRSSESCLIENEYIVLLVNTDNIKTFMYFNIGDIVYNDKYDDAEKKDNSNISNKKCGDDEKWGILPDLRKKIDDIVDTAAANNNMGSFSQYSDLLCAPKDEKNRYNEIFVFNHPIDDVTFNLLLKITVNTHILWKQERIIWIAFYKNEKNIKCLVSQLPKDIVKKILNFLH